MFRSISLALLLVLGLAPAASAKSGHCPPGLAKKAVPCVPPGQARKATRPWEAGDYLDDGDYHIVTYPRRYGLPPLPAGQHYMIVGNRLMVVNDNNYQILSILQAVQAILD